LGLDIYVGSFTRYYAGDWELVAARVARELGATFEVVRQHNPPDAIRDPEKIRSIVLEWRSGLAASLASHLPEPLDWDESPDAPYFTDKPCWDGYQGLLLWAAYHEHPQFKIPVNFPEDKDFARDPAIDRSMGADSQTAYPSLFSNAQFWLPARFPFVFEAPDASGKKVRMASSVSLAQELSELNRKTWNMDESELDQCAMDGCEEGSPLEVAARFGYALFRRHALLSVTHRLPFLLDW
jgi:hypothetical protein